MLGNEVIWLGANVHYLRCSTWWKTGECGSEKHTKVAQLGNWHDTVSFSGSCTEQIHSAAV